MGTWDSEVHKLWGGGVEALYGLNEGHKLGVRVIMVVGVGGMAGQRARGVGREYLKGDLWVSVTPCLLKLAQRGPLSASHLQEAHWLKITVSAPECTPLSTAQVWGPAWINATGPQRTRNENHEFNATYKMSPNANRISLLEIVLHNAPKHGTMQSNHENKICQHTIVN